jgi:hypothetical protein
MGVRRPLCQGERRPAKAGFEEITTRHRHTHTPVPKCARSFPIELQTIEARCFSSLRRGRLPGRRRAMQQNTSATRCIVRAMPYQEALLLGTCLRSKPSLCCRICLNAAKSVLPALWLRRCSAPLRYPGWRGRLRMRGWKRDMCRSDDIDIAG